VDLQLKDKVVVVTGGAKGIGAAIVRTCADEGAVPVIVDRDRESGDQLKDELRKRGIRSELITVDLTTADNCAKSIEVVLKCSVDSTRW
jgi:L-fucose dehydrogenase